MRSLMLIVNPAAGRSGYKVNLGEALLTLNNGGFRTTLFFTKGVGDATNFAAQYGSDYDVVACVGGDGTLSETLAGLMTLKNPPPVGYFPMGTANDVATTIGLPKNDTVGAARRLVEGTEHPFDVGGFGSNQYFAYIAAFGAFTEVSYITPQDQKKALGHLAYVLQGAGALNRIEPIHTIVEYDDGVIEQDLLYGSLSNSTSVAGIVHLKETMVSLGDGYSELVLVKDPKRLDAFGELVTKVLSQNYDSEYLTILHTKKAKFIFDKPIAWTRDGEAGGEVKEIELCNYHAPVRLIF